MDKKVRVLLPGKTGFINVNSKARTFGELRSEFANSDNDHLQNANWLNLVATIGETRNTLESPEAILPDYDFRIYVHQKKHKGGNNDYSSWSHKDLRHECSTRPAIREKYSNKGNYSTREQMIEYLHEDDANSSSENEIEELVEAIEEIKMEALELAIDLFDNLKDGVKRVLSEAVMEEGTSEPADIEDYAKVKSDLTKILF